MLTAAGVGVDGGAQGFEGLSNHRQLALVDECNNGVLDVGHVVSPFLSIEETRRGVTGVFGHRTCLGKLLEFLSLQVGVCASPIVVQGFTAGL